MRWILIVLAVVLLVGLAGCASDAGDGVGVELDDDGTDDEAEGDAATDDEPADDGAPDTDGAADDANGTDGDDDATAADGDDVETDDVDDTDGTDDATDDSRDDADDADETDDADDADADTTDEPDEADDADETDDADDADADTTDEPDDADDGTDIDDGDETDDSDTTDADDAETDDATADQQRVAHSLEVSEMNVANVSPEEEYINLENTGDCVLRLGDWQIRDREDGGQVARGLEPFVFPSDYVLDPGQSVTIWTGDGEDTETNLYWGYGVNMWNASGDVIIVMDPDGEHVVEHEYDDQMDD